MTQFENLQHQDTSQKITELNVFYKNILNSIKNGVWVTNKDDVIEYTNTGMEIIAGISSDHIIGAQVLKDFPESTLKFFKPIYLKAKEKLTPFFYESIPVITPAGRRSYQSGWLIPRIKEGSFDGMVCTVDDITENKKAEKKIKDQNEYLIKIINSLPHPFYVINVDDFTLELANSALLPDIPSEKMTCYALTHKRDKPCEGEHLCPLKEVKKTKKSVVVEHIHYNAEGNAKYYEVHAHPILDKDENVIQVIEYNLDITERKISEQALKKREHDLEERIKELTCLYGISRLIELNNISIEQIISDILNLIPPAWQYPEITCARITYAGNISSTKNYAKKKWGQKAEIKVSNEVVGSIQIYYLKKKPKEDEGPFLKEERDLINALAEILSRFFERKKVELSINRLNLELEQKVKERTSQLQESESRYRELFNNMSSGVAVYEAVNNGDDFIFVDLNLGGERIDDIKKEVLLGKKVTEVYPSVKNFGLLDVFQRVYRTGQPEHFPISLYQDKRISGWRENYVYKLPSEEIVSVYDDITERKKAEEELKKFKSISDNANYGAAIIDLEGSLTYSNDYFASIHGYKTHELIGCGFSIFHNDNQLERVMELKQKLLEEGSYAAEEVWHTHRDGSVFPMLMNGIIINDNKGNPLFMAATAIDISKRQKTEDELKESEKNYRTLANNIPGMVYRGDIDWFPSFITKCEVVSGYSIDEFISQKVNWVDIIHPDDKEKIMKECLKLVDNPLEISLDYRIITKDGTVRWVKDRKTSLFTDEGKYKGADGIVFDITDRIKVEQKLKESEKRFSTAWYMNSNLMAISDLETGKYIEVNNAFLETIKVTRKEIIGKSAKFLYSDPSDRDLLIKELKKNGKVVNYELKFKNMLGEPLLGLFSFDVVEMEGKPYLISVAKDITERKQAEQELKESEERFRSTFEQAAVGIAHVAPDGTFLRINQRYCDIVKYSRTEMLSRSFQDITYQDDLEEDLNFIQLMLLGKLLNYSMDKRYICKDGSIVWVNLTVALIRKASGDPNYFISVVEDISEKKVAEEKLKESEESYRLFIENFRGIAFKGYQDFSVGFFRGAIEKITGYEEEDFSSERIKWDQLIHPEDMPIIRKKIEEFHESPQNSAQREYRIIDKNGKIHWLLESIQKIQDKSSSKDGVQGTIIDITDKKEAEELIIEENIKLQKLNQMKIDLINRISHELKTPLNAIFGSIQLLLEDLDKDSDDDKYKLGKLIYKGGERLRQIVFDLIDSSKFELKRIKLKKKKEDLNAVLKDCIEELIFLANKRKIFVSADLGETKYLNVDRPRFEQVIFNIISNAIKNTQTGGRIFVKLSDNREYLDISIKDTGIGITDEEKDKLFTKFGKIERYGKGLDVDIDGWGLGLFLSKEIVLLHGGEIIVKSEGRNKGAEFIIRFSKTEQN